MGISDATRLAQPIRFVHRGRVREIRGVDPNTTVLEWLRMAAGLTGTKEGCAEGDCGACTIVLGERHAGRLRYRAVNACIQFVPTLDGKQLITVEDLRGQDGALHPVQRAMVEQHGSQCGFCTPGIVMSLLALYQSGPPTRAAINDALAGNLCRCTGYRPIVDAAFAMHGYGKSDHFARAERETLALLEAIERESGLAYEAAGRRYFAPTSEDELASVLEREPEARILAGGTDLALEVTKQHRDLDALVYVGGVRDMAGIARGQTHIEIGAAAPYTDAMTAIGEAYPDFAELLRRLGSVQIRNAGTMGGNIANASPAGDTFPPLAVYQATVRVNGPEGRRILALSEFFTGVKKTALKPGELVESVFLPFPPRKPTRAMFRKVGTRAAQAISKTMFAGVLWLKGRKVEEVRLAFGSLAPTVRRLHAAEALLKGRTLDAAAIDAAAGLLTSDVSPIDDIRSTREYRLAVSRALLVSFLKGDSR